MGMAIACAARGCTVRSGQACTSPPGADIAAQSRTGADRGVTSPSGADPSVAVLSGAVLSQVRTVQFRGEPSVRSGTPTRRRSPGRTIRCSSRPGRTLQHSTWPVRTALCRTALLGRHAQAALDGMPPASPCSAICLSLPWASPGRKGLTALRHGGRVHGGRASGEWMPPKGAAHLSGTQARIGPIRYGAALSWTDIF